MLVEPRVHYPWLDQPNVSGNRSDMATVSHERLGIATDDIVAWTRAFVRHPSPQTERFEYEPQVQSFIADQVVPLVAKLGLPARRDPMATLIVELGPKRPKKSLRLMAKAITNPRSRRRTPSRAS